MSEAVTVLRLSRVMIFAAASAMATTGCMATSCPVLIPPGSRKRRICHGLPMLTSKGEERTLRTAGAGMKAPAVDNVPSANRSA